MSNVMRWEKLGRVLAPDRKLAWMSTYTGAAFALRHEGSSVVDLYVTGRDDQNRSQIGLARLDLTRPTQVLDLTPEPVFTWGERGAFDENGVSYPWFVRHGGELFMFYVGWMPTVLAPFMVSLGMARQEPDGRFSRVSRAPILPRTDEEPFSTGSVCVGIEDGLWRMWYTSFLRWGNGPSDHKHYYVIKYAESVDGRSWTRPNRTCIGFTGPAEYAIARPSVLRWNGSFHMWFCTRGEQYRIGYARSSDGLAWTREASGIDVSPSGWDSIAQCYPHVIAHGDDLFMFYNGNDYGREGLGVARLCR
jgi:hypothetical protein